MSRRPPTVSVLMPVYNAGSALCDAVASVLSSHFTDFELVVVNDGSTDGSTQTLERIARTDDRVRLLSGAHRGIVSTLNRGLSVCQGQFIARMDADDWTHPERLGRQLAWFGANPELGVVSCHVQIERPDGAEVDRGMQRYQRWLNSLTTPVEISRSRFVESPVVHPTVMVRREHLRDGYRLGPFPEDYDLWLRLLQRGVHFAKVPEVLFHWRDGSQRLTRTDPRCSNAAFRNLKLHHLIDGVLSHRPRYTLWGVGQTGKPWLRALIEAGRPPDMALDIDPRRIGQQIHGVTVKHPTELLERGPNCGFTLVAVGALGARETIEAQLAHHGFEPERDYLCLA